jgi:hypothetical protein
MKINGASFTGPNTALVVLIRNGEPVAFKAQAVLDYALFDTLVPQPKPKTIVRPGTGPEMLFNDPGYLQQFQNYGQIKTNYVIVQSLKATPGLEWETIKDDQPETWGNFRKELEAAFFTSTEINRIIACVWEANGIDEDKLDEARKRFLASQDQVPEKST